MDVSMVQATLFTQALARARYKTVQALSAEFILLTFSPQFARQCMEKSASLQQTLAGGTVNCLRPRAHVELAVHVLDVRVDGLRADGQTCADLIEPPRV
jgi:hypothetical protein